ncbi:fatty acyl-AMP ligase [Stenomitos frigidus]|uniref:AMP-dependent synthetase n=1 Tax=Stenomitos frigidus ULC18 TaxID=2107698 RepID=A0A2T1DX17_9CYAN|nr:fatty acyl-AMP ligase [Stenomitos frigidus]PSB25012.1 AMP-dependent synthetase [Stenomitos frigidus ULC18]
MSQSLDPFGLKLSPKSLLDVLEYRASRQPEQTAYTFLVDGEREEISLTYEELHQRVNSLACHLSTLVAPGERALLLYPPGLDYIIAFFACLQSRLIAVPAYPPRPNKSISRLQEIVKDAQPGLALTTQAVLLKAKDLFTQILNADTLPCLATDVSHPALVKDWETPEINRQTLAFLQYTSGSTGTPKGVMITHGNILHNSALIYNAFTHQSQSKGLVWLPPYHDMGLIGGILQPLYGGFPVILMSPAHFLQKPLRWLQAISHYRATTSGGPDFAYDLCVRKVTAKQKEELDLSSWDLAFNGSEVIRTKTLADFARTFESCGFSQKSFYPCYGLAEATLLVSGGPKTKELLVHSIRKSDLEQHRSLNDVSEAAAVEAVISCGQIRCRQVVIVHPDTLAMCSSDQIGEVWVSDASVALGYWNQDSETRKNFDAYLGTQGPFLRTGDLGFLQDGNLFITGRIKDIIIIRGCNYYPHDIELTVEQSHPAIQSAPGAAFSVEMNGEAKLVIVQEVRRDRLRDLPTQKVMARIRESVAAQHGLQVFSIVLIKPGCIPKTSSGKIQRYACRSLFLNSAFDVIKEHGGNTKANKDC